MSEEKLLYGSGIFNRNLFIQIFADGENIDYCICMVIVHLIHSQQQSQQLK